MKDLLTFVCLLLFVEGPWLVGKEEEERKKEEKNKKREERVKMGWCIYTRNVNRRWLSFS